MNAALVLGIERESLIEFLVGRPLRIFLILVAAVVLTRIANRAIERFAARIVAHAETTRTTRGIDFGARARQRTTTLGAVLRSVAHIIIWVIASLLVLGELEINLAPLLAGAGIAGVAIGFGAQSLVRDFLAGIFIIIEDQFGVDDIIDLGPDIGVVAQVEEVTLRTTRVRDVDGVQWIIPNGEIRQVGNTSQTWSRAVLDIGVAYDTDIDHATEVLDRVLRTRWEEGTEVSRIIEEPSVLGVERFDADAVTIRALVKTEPGTQYTVARELRGRIKQAFDAEAIEIPFPQRTVWLKQEPNVDGNYN